MLDTRDERKIVRVSVGHPKLTARQVRSKCNFNSEVSVDTVRIYEKNNSNWRMVAKNH